MEAYLTANGGSAPADSAMVRPRVQQQKNWTATRPGRAAAWRITDTGKGSLRHPAWANNEEVPGGKVRRRLTRWFFSPMRLWKPNGKLCGLRTRPLWVTSRIAVAFRPLAAVGPASAPDLGLRTWSHRLNLKQGRAKIEAVGNSPAAFCLSCGK